jgi:hypothetical protein
MTCWRAVTRTYTCAYNPAGALIGATLGLDGANPQDRSLPAPAIRPCTSKVPKLDRIASG